MYVRERMAHSSLHSLKTHGDRFSLTVYSRSCGIPDWLSSFLNCHQGLNMLQWTLIFVIPVCASPLLLSASPSGDPPVVKSPSLCAGRACNPRMGNLAQGRVILTQTVCGSNSTESYCSYHHTSSSTPYHKEAACGSPECGTCDAALPLQAHLASAMADDSFRNPDTWWQSAEGVETETVQLDWETSFYFTHLIMVFRSPRPAAMQLERSQDNGKTWNTLRYFARDCEGTFGLADEASPREGGGGGAGCTSQYSAALPCTRGEVIYRALTPWHTLDPYSQSAHAQLMVTNLRVRLLQRQPCPCQANDPGGQGLPTAHYAIYDFIVKGSCLCNGHAEHCVPSGGYRPVKQRTNHVVHGRCVCRHNTAGHHCERCAPLYNDRPWQAASGITGAPHECKKCVCHGHAHSCHFDRGAWWSSGRRSGGVCDSCLHNTEGRRCQSCRRGFYRYPGRRGSAPDSCTPCLCHPLGSLTSLSGGYAPCNPSNGDCTCKPGVAGPLCDKCMVGFWGLHGYGCRPCDCGGGNCDPYTGDCLSGSDLAVSSAGSREPAGLFGVQGLFSALHHSEKCECKEMSIGSPRVFCAQAYDYVLMVRILAARDQGSHAEVEVVVKKVLYHSSQMKIPQGHVVLHPESWTTRGCTCPLLNPGSKYLVAGHMSWRTGSLLVNTRSLVKPWRPSLGSKLLHLLNQHCGTSSSSLKESAAGRLQNTHSSGAPLYSAEKRLDLCHGMKKGMIRGMEK
ncbi:netrin-4 [Esox lucius]|uniref:Netrin-1 n=1 Tax=Esox lucius TaxID=8010 RepID=A0A3P8XU97_ESOLU|nr:netrin-4 [Esox lucius]